MTLKKHRIDVLIKDLTEPPKVEQLDDNHQKFNGVNYRKDNHGHYSTWQGIHQVVYRYYFDNIPEGYEIHHRDKIKSNNDISNLQMLTKAEHRKTHRCARPAQKCICVVCGKEFLSHSLTKAKFCSSKCSGVYERLINPFHLKNCPCCGKEFRTALPKQKFCSRSCAMKYRHLQNKTVKIN